MTPTDTYGRSVRLTVVEPKGIGEGNAEVGISLPCTGLLVCN
jgi:hypothetical protein